MELLPAAFADLLLGKQSHLLLPRLSLLLRLSTGIFGLAHQPGGLTGHALYLRAGGFNLVDVDLDAALHLLHSGDLGADEENRRPDRINDWVEEHAATILSLRLIEPITEHVDVPPRRRGRLFDDRFVLADELAGNDVLPVSPAVHAVGAGARAGA